MDQHLDTARGHTSLATYADEVLHTSRDNVYKTIEAAEILRTVLAAPRVSKIFDTPPNASQAKALAPVLALDSGEDKAVEILTDIQASGKKPTAAALAAAAKRLGYTATIPTPASGTDADDARRRAARHRQALMSLGCPRPLWLFHHGRDSRKSQPAAVWVVSPFG